MGADEFRDYILGFIFYKYLSDHGLFHPAQSGFRKLHSTITCGLSVTNDILKAMDNGNNVGFVFLDLKKAFDTVDHAILCEKLARYGVTDSGVAWFSK